MLKKIRVMIADNNHEICRAVAEAFAVQEDLELVATAHDGRKALEMIDRIKPDVLLLDITMPLLDGIGVLEALRGKKDKPIIIMLSAFEHQTMIQRSMSMGASYYIIKPFNMLMLLDRVRDFSSKTDYTVNNTQVSENKVVYMPSRFEEQNHLQQERRVTNLFHEMGVPAHFRGYAYLRDAIMIAIQEENDLFGNITRSLYPRIAEKYRTTASGVESAIRHTIEITWERGNQELFQEIFSSDGRNRHRCFPTSSAFIAKVADRLRMEEKVAR